MTRPLAAVALALTIAGGVHAQDGVFRARTDGVAIDVSVMDGTNPVTGLTIKDFRLRADGVTQTLVDVGREPLPLDITLTIDISSSVTPDKQAMIERAIEQVSATLTSDDRCSVVSFDNRVLEEAALHHPPLKFSLTRRTGGTSLIDTLLLSMVTAPTVGRRQLNLVLTDGMDTTSFFDKQRVKDTMQFSSAQTSVVLVRAGRVSIYDNPARTLMDDVTSTSGGQIVVLENDEQLSAAFLKTLEHFRMSYLLRFVPAGVSREGWHPVDVTVPGHRYAIRARQGYWFTK